MRTIKYFFLLALLVLPSCEFSDLFNASKNLGDFNYIAQDPKISFKINSYEFNLPDDSYSSMSVKYSINVKQNAADFPVKMYDLIAYFDVVDENNITYHTIQISETMNDVVMAISDEDKLYGLDKSNYVKYKSFKLKPKSYRWFPKIEFKPYEQ